MPKIASSCPVFLNGTSDIPELKDHLKEVVLVTFDDTWKKLPLQIDQLNAYGGIEYGKDGKVPTGKHQRLVFATEGFGRIKPPEASYPCKQKIGYKIIDYDNSDRVAYLLACTEEETQRLPEAAAKKKAPQYIEEKRLIFDNYYSYVLNNLNQMLFEQIALGSGSDRYVAAYNSDMQIHASLQSLFSVTFDSSDIESKVINHRQGPVGLNARLSFFLNMLLFKISLSLTTDVSFFSDSAYIPMVLSLPVDANRYLNPKSGIFYHWVSGSETKSSAATVNMPTFSQTLLDQLMKTPAYTKEVVEKYCPGTKWCYFNYKLGGRKLFDMNFRIRKNLVEAGFFPTYVENMEEFEKIAGWTAARSAQRRGFFFSTVALTAGSYVWELWLRLAEQSEDQGLCPHPVSLRDLD